jgi:hypothetical protein
VYLCGDRLGAMLLLATSCLQGEPLARACLTLLALGGDGLQLCPGNLPSPGLEALLSRVQTTLRLHHGFTWDARVAPVWDADGAPLLPMAGRSVHPPQTTPTGGLAAWLARAAGEGWVVELMPPGWILSDEGSIDAAMAAGLRLAVDVSHLHILRAAGRLSEAGERRVMDYAHIAELHVSDNDGRLDLHRPTTRESYGVGWARERKSAETPMILESYLHALNNDARKTLLERLQAP